MTEYLTKKLRVPWNKIYRTKWRPIVSIYSSEKKGITIIDDDYILIRCNGKNCKTSNKGKWLTELTL